MLYKTGAHSRDIRVNGRYHEPKQGLKHDLIEVKRDVGRKNTTNTKCGLEAAQRTSNIEEDMVRDTGYRFKKITKQEDPEQS